MWGKRLFSFTRKGFGGETLYKEYYGLENIQIHDIYFKENHNFVSYETEHSKHL